MGVIRFDEVFEKEIRAVAARRLLYRKHWRPPGRAESRKHLAESGEPPPLDPEPQTMPALELEAVDVDGHPIKRPTKETELIGLALSGGGVRSAAFCLGALQALDEEKVLCRVDYLSTVSGGGYIGTSMVAAMSVSASSKFPFPSKLTPEENPPLRHVRDHSNYLIPRGLGDIFGNLGIYLRGLMANAILLLPWLALAAWITISVYPTPDHIQHLDEHLYRTLRLTMFGLDYFAITAAAAILIGLWFAFWALHRSLWPGGGDVNGWMLFAGSALILLCVIAWCDLQPYVLAKMIAPKPVDPAAGTVGGRWSDWVSLATKFLAAFSALVGIFSTVFADLLKRDKDTSATRRAWILPFLAKAAIYVAAATVPLLLWIAYLYFSVWGICAPIGQPPPPELQCSAAMNTPGWLLALGDPNFWVTIFDWIKRVTPEWLAGPVAQIGHLIWGVVQVVGLLLKTAWGIAKALLWIAQLIVPDSISKAIGAIASWISSECTWLYGRTFAGPMHFFYAAVFFVVFLIQLVLLPNANSLHRLYRDRLSKAFLFHPGQRVKDERASLGNSLRNWIGKWTGKLPVGLTDPCARFGMAVKKGVVRVFDRVTKPIVRIGRWLSEKKSDGARPDEPVAPEDVKTLEPLDQLKFSTIKAKFGPYQIINAALNIRGSKYANQRGRNADFFVFTSKYTGSRATDYVPTPSVERAVSDLDLAAAMAISGAAASSNMGANTIKALTPTLAILNIRLGFWLPNPRVIAGGILKSRWAKLIDQFYFLAELLGRLTEDSDLIYLTDGGHIENLGIYELLRRRCALIIAVDAEADPGMNFNSFIALQRHALIDLGVRINLPWSTIRDATRAAGELVAKTGGVDWGHAKHGPHVALGKIDYPVGREGVLLYIKSSLSGDENDYIIDYKRRNSRFPHETTADQFFTEEQFEVYRALGFHATRRALNGGDEVALPSGCLAWSGQGLDRKELQAARRLLFGGAHERKTRRAALAKLKNRNNERETIKTSLA